MTTWPFFPNWKSPYRETYGYLTEIISSDSGREQRRAYRLAARRTVEYSALVQKDRFRALRRALNQHGAVVVFPDEVRRIALTADSSLGSQSITVSEIPAWAVVGRDAVLEDRSTRERAVRAIDTIVGLVISFTDAADRAWSTGSRVMPALVGTLDPTIKTRVPTDHVASGTVGLIVEPGTEIETPGFADVTFAGREVLAVRPNWSEALQLDSSDPTEWVDYEMGVRSPYRLVDFVTEIRRATYLIQDAASLNATLGLFMRCKGRRGEFYVPSGLSDIDLAAPLAPGGTTWTVTGHDFYDAYVNDTVRKAIAVRLNTGAVHYFRVAGLTKSSSGAARSFLATVETAPVAITPADVRSISWMPVCRFASDDLTLTWITDRHAEVVINVQTLEDLP